MSTTLFPAHTFALLGNPVAHSLSPIFQNAAFHAAGVQATYIALQCEADEVAGHIRELTRSGGGGNVTIPYKTVAAGIIENATEELALTGACNTFWMEGGRVCGDNTDVAGFKAALSALAGDVMTARVLLLGAGGAARAAVLGLRQLGAASVAVWNRSPARFNELRTHAEPLGLPIKPYDRRERFDIIINATSIGLHGQTTPPISATDVGARYALDLVYRVGGTPWVTAAVATGVRAADGLEMLLHQGARAFERWFRTPAPLDVMRTALTEVARTP